MCGHLMAAGHEAAVFSRTAAKCAPLVAKGATLATSPREAAEKVFRLLQCATRADAASSSTAN